MGGVLQGLLRGIMAVYTLAHVFAQNPRQTPGCGCSSGLGRSIDRWAESDLRGAQRLGGVPLLEVSELQAKDGLGFLGV